MKIDELLNQELDIKNTRLPLKVILDNTDNNITNFITNINNNISTEFVNAYTTLIDQLLGHFNQLIVKYGDGVKSKDLEHLIALKETLREEFENSKDTLSLDKKNITFPKIYNQLKEYYNSLVIEINKSLTNHEIISEYNNLVKKVNINLDCLKDKELDNKTITEIISLYKNICNNVNALTSLETLVTKTESLLIEPDNNKGKSVNQTIKVFDLFAKINDQIIDSTFTFSSKDNLTYAVYKLEDQSNYFAIVKNEQDIKILEQSFMSLPNLVLTKDNIINTCRTIIKNAEIYYDVNEFMRYIEMSYKTKMTKEIDQVVANYKSRLTNLEEMLKKQLTFIDDIALLVNKRPCSNYPNIVYTDVSLDQYFPIKSSDSKEREIEHLITNIILNPDIKTTFDTASILKTMYSDEIIHELENSSLNLKRVTPIVDTGNLVTDLKLPTTQELVTNSTKISSYLAERLNELNLLKNSATVNVTLTRDSNPLFKDINTVFDLHTAIVICDKVYKKGQGLFAVKDYLRTGELLKFTSKYQARSLVENVDRANYLRLLLESILKDYLLNKGSHLVTNYVRNYLLKDEFNLQVALENLLKDDSLLEDVITNYNYQYLDSLSSDAKLTKELLLNNTSEMLKINNLLIKIKKNITLEQLKK